MSKLNKKTVDQKDFIDYLNNNSDFSFEMKVLNKLVDMEFQCQNGGTYIDPFSQKPREFDIRAKKHITEERVIHLAVECKNIKKNFPLLIIRVPRKQEEGFHDFFFSYTPNYDSIHLPGMTPSAEVKRMKGDASIYKPNDFVGKSLVQVGYNNQNEMIFNDSEVYNKWSQALSSSDELMQDCYYEGESSGIGFAFSAVLPMLVVPDDTLWVVDFDEKGNQTTEPRKFERCPYYVNMPFEAGSKLTSVQYTISHIEFITFSEIEKYLSYICSEPKLLFDEDLVFGKEK